MAFTVQEFASNIVITSSATITVTFGTAIQAGETVVIVATYIGTLGAGTCADGSARAFTQGSTVAGVGWTMTTFYYLNHPGGDTTVTFTVPSAVTNKGIMGWRNTPTNTASYGGSDSATLSSPGTGTDAVTTATIAATSDAIVICGAININSPNTLTAGTSFTSDGLAWNNYGRGEHRAISSAGSYAGTMTSSNAGNNYLIGAVVIDDIPPAGGGGRTRLFIQNINRMGQR